MHESKLFAPLIKQFAAMFFNQKSKMWLICQTSVWEVIFAGRTCLKFISFHELHDEVAI